jgi:hypothetical protein
MTRPIVESFHATLERLSSRLNWVLIRIPLGVPKIWGTRGRLRVKGEINGFGFRTSLFPTGEGDQIMLANKRMQSGGKAVPGTVAQFRLEPDTEARVVTKRALGEDRSLRRWFEPAELLHTQGNRRLDHTGEKR